MSKRERKELTILRDKMDRITKHTKKDGVMNQVTCSDLSVRVRLNNIKRIVEGDI